MLETPVVQLWLKAEPEDEAVWHQKLVVRYSTKDVCLLVAYFWRNGPLGPVGMVPSKHATLVYIGCGGAGGAALAQGRTGGRGHVAPQARGACVFPPEFPPAAAWGQGLLMHGVYTYTQYERSTESLIQSTLIRSRPVPSPQEAVERATTLRMETASSNSPTKPELLRAGSIALKPGERPPDDDDDDDDEEAEEGEGDEQGGEDEEKDQGDTTKEQPQSAQAQVWRS
jgi:hypothetical protein